MNTCLLLTLLAVSASTVTATTTTCTKPSGAVLELVSNYIYGTTHKNFRVLYPGVQNAQSSVTIKIFKAQEVEGTHQSEENAFMTYTVPDNKKSEREVIYLANKDATPGYYFTQVCDGENCSEKIKSLTELPNEGDKGKLTCNRVTWDSATSSEKAVSAGNFEINIIAPKQFETNVSGFKKLSAKGVTTGEPSYLNGVLYAGFKYNMSHYKQLFETLQYKEATEVTQIKAGGSQQFAGEYCDRKYSLVVSYILVKPDTNEIKYRFKTTLFGSPQLVKAYILGNRGEVPIALEHEETIASGTYKAWVSICAVGKDIIDFEVECSDSIIGDLTV